MVKKNTLIFNTDKRKNATNSFEKDFFELMSNSAFGKAVENLSKRINVRVVSSTKTILNIQAKPSFFSQKIFNKNFVAIHEIKPVLTINKPIYVGFSILDLNKFIMYGFHFNCIDS